MLCTLVYAAVSKSVRDRIPFCSYSCIMEISIEVQPVVSLWHPDTQTGRRDHVHMVSKGESEFVYLVRLHLHAKSVLPRSQQTLILEVNLSEVY